MTEQSQQPRPLIDRSPEEIEAFLSEQRDAYEALALEGELEITQDGSIPQLAERVGYRVVQPGTPSDIGVLATPQLADASLGPKKSCSVTVQYAPTAEGATSSATLRAASKKPLAVAPTPPSAGRAASRCARTARRRAWP